MFVDRVRGDGVVLLVVMVVVVVALVSGWYDWRDKGWLGGRVRGLNKRPDVWIGRMRLRLNRERETLNGRRVLRRECILSSNIEK